MKVVVMGEEGSGGKTQRRGVEVWVTGNGLDGSGLAVFMTAHREKATRGSFV